MVQFKRRAATPKDDAPKTGDLTHSPENAPKVGGGFAKEHLYSFVERLERLDEERQGIVDDMKEVRSEAKGTGFDTKIIGVLIRRRKMDPASRMEADTILDLYERAVQEAAADQVAASEAEGT